MTGKPWRTYTVTVFDRSPITLSARSRSAARWDAISRLREVYDFSIVEALQQSTVALADRQPTERYDYVRRFYGFPADAGIRVRERDGQHRAGQIVLPPGSSAHVHVVLDGATHAMPYHPSDLELAR